MIENGWGHIVNCRLPISTEVSPGYVCYIITKMGASRLAIGVTAEHENDNAAVNALWVATPIESRATIHWGNEKMIDRSHWHSTGICSDALMEILPTDPRELTSWQLTDEEILRERGWS